MFSHYRKKEAPFLAELSMRGNRIVLGIAVSCNLKVTIDTYVQPVSDQRPPRVAIVVRDARVLFEVKQTIRFFFKERKGQKAVAFCPSAQQNNCRQLIIPVAG